ncbi:uncharacterized protein LOC144122124 [Amblyomma americanum]
MVVARMPTLLLQCRTVGPYDYVICPLRWRTCVRSSTTISESSTATHASHEVGHDLEYAG